MARQSPSIVEISLHSTSIIFSGRCHTHVSFSFAGDWNMPNVYMPLMLLMMIYLLLCSQQKCHFSNGWTNEHFSRCLLMIIFICVPMSTCVCVCVRQIRSSLCVFFRCTFVFLSLIETINDDGKKTRRRTTVDFSLALKIEQLIVWLLAEEKAVSVQVSPRARLRQKIECVCWTS